MQVLLLRMQELLKFHILTFEISKQTNIMLQKQASNAAVHAKDAIVKGATISVLNSLKEFEKNGIQLNNKEKTNYVSEMMNTLCMGSGMSKIMPKT